MSVDRERVRREITRFSKFTVVGAFGALVDFGFFNILSVIFGIPGTIAQAFSFTAAVTSNFLWNRFWTYPDSRNKPISQQAIQFYLLNIVGLLIRTPIFVFSEKPMMELSRQLLGAIPSSLPSTFKSISDINPETLGSNFALAIAVIVVLFWNFISNRLWTYSDVN